MLRERDLTDVCIEDFQVRFHTSLWSDHERAGFLAGYGTGVFDIEAGIDEPIVHYSFDAVRQAVICFACAALFLAAAYDGSLRSLGDNWGLAMIIVLAFFGFNHVSAWVRMPFWLRKGLRDMPELQAQ